MEVHVARQPIFTVPSGPVGLLDRAAEVLAGYELLFRDGPNNAFPDVDGDVATSKVLHHSFFANDFDELVGHTLGFVNFTRELLVKRVPKMFPPRRLVVEVLESVAPDAEVVEACKELKRLGYHIVLDDFVMAPGMDALLDIAWMVKFDVRSTPIPAIASMIEKFKNRDIRFLAEKVETRAELAALRDVGCTWFQGYFFARPEMVTRTDVAPAKMVLLKLMHEVMRPEQDLAALERLIAADVSMSYKLLRYINSAYFGRPQKIESIRQALVLLGEREVRQMVMLVATARLATRKPTELMRLSVMRARMAETLAAKIPGVAREELFVVGLFSSIDAIMDRPMAQLVNQLPLTMEVKRALVDRLGVLGAVLNLVLAYERADWAEVARLVSAFKLDGKDLPLAHQSALRAGEAFLEGED
ncbi:MAG TPA: HDOD domain-containing protein [Myxococcota bacterium]|nr:HDOD domain-containing protein [Myxococcota bacterium]